MVTHVIIALALAQSPVDVALAHARCQCVAGGVCECKECVCFPDYAHIEDGCRKQQKPCIVFVGVKPRRVEGFTIASQKTFCDDTKCVSGCIVVGVWRGGSFIRHDLPGTATDDAIRSLLNPASAGSSRPVGSYAPTGFTIFRRGGC